MTIVRTPETKVKETCDQMIAWGFCCSSRAAFIVTKHDSVEYAIMCEQHKQGFLKEYPNFPVTVHEWSMELNQQFADKANAYWAKQAEVNDGK